MTPGPGRRVPDRGRPDGSRGRVAANRPASLRLGEADLLALQGGVVEGGDDDELVAVPLGGLTELDVECLAGGGITVPSGRVICPLKVPVEWVTTVIQSPVPNWMG
jgi:hypothetical protein